MDFRRPYPTGRQFQGCRAIVAAIFAILWFATLIWPGYVYSQTGFSLSADANGAAGDQGVTALNTSPEQRVSIQLFGRNLQDARGVSVRFEYDVSQAVYEASENGDILPNAQVLVETGTNPTFVKVSFASFAGRATAATGLVGTIHFRTTAAFEGTTIRLTLAELGRGGPIERLPLNLNIEVSSGPVAPSPDFDADGRVGFSDFLIFAEQFGTQQGDGQYDARIDLDSDGAVGFSDFLIFAEAFGAVVETPSGFAPADQDAFDRLAVGKRILLETFFLDIVSAGRFTEGFRRHEGRYAYTNTGANTAQFTQTYDNPELFGGRCTTRLTFTSPTTGTARFACDNGATGETENWSLSDLATPMFLRAAPDTLYFAFRDTWRAGQTRAYDLQLREKTPQGRWNDVCVTYSNRSDNSITAYALPWIYSPALEPNTTYEFRYRYRNSSSCDTGSPGPWSPIAEGATPGSGTGGGGGGGGGGGRPDLVVDSPSVSNSRPTAGASFTLSATVRNQGTGQSTATTLRYYRSTDATITDIDTEVGTDAVGVLAAPGASSESISLNAPSDAGIFYYGACVESVSGESDTGNNCSAAVAVTVGAPDLVVDAPTVSTSSPTAGASFTLSATVRNQGTGQSAAATTLRYYRSTNTTITTQDTQVGTDAVGVLGASRTSAESIGLTAPSSAGTYYYGACVESVSGESNAGNNCSPAVTVTVGAAPAPDLVVDAPTVSNSSPTAGASFTLNATVRNQGTGQSTATTLRYYRSTDATITDIDTEVGTDAVGVLAASRTSAESIGLTAPSSAGTYYYGACVESVSGESNAGNNCSPAVTVTVGAAPAPDLVVDTPTVSTSSPTAGASFTLSATVRNQGNGQSAATTLRYYRSTDATITTRDTEVGTDAVGVLVAPGTSAESIRLNAPSDAGIFYYGACVDAVSGESDSENNCSAAVTVNVVAPDLVVDVPTVSTSSPTAGASFTLSATVRNQGSGASAAATLRWYLSTDATVSTSDTEVGTALVSTLAASRISSESISLTAPSSAGTYYYGACVESVSGESDAGNNCSPAVTVTVGAAPAPDLVVDTPTVSTSSPTAGASFTLSATVRNQANGQSVATTLRWYLSTDATITTRDTEVGTDAVGVLAAPGTSAESIRLNAPSDAGTYYYGACVDAVSGESDSENNCSAAVTVTVVAPDLVVEAPTVSNSRPTAGASFTLSATVRNQGSGASAATTTLRYYRSTDATITTQDTQVGTDAVGVLAAPGTSAESISLNAPSDAGIFYYGACVDAVSGESDSENNCSLAVTVTVVAPDLVVDTPTVSTSSPTAGASFTLSATVRNQGNGQSAATTLRFFRSTDGTISASDTEAGSDAVGGLAASGTSDHSIELTAPSSAGTYYYGACVESVSGESDTGNNCSAAVTVTVGAPDLVVDSPSVSTSSPTAGASFTLSATVRNQGTGQSTATTLRYYRSTDATITDIDTEVGTDAVGVLAASRTSAESISLTAPASAGAYYYGACVESVSDESDTGNNCSAAVTVTVGAPDLVVDAPTVSNSRPTAGASFTLRATVRNQGNRPSAAATTLRYYRSTDATITTRDTEVGTDAVGVLAAPGTSAESISLNAPSDAGIFYYGACVDAVSGESDTGNNCSLAVTVTVGAAPATDLVVDAPTVSNSTPTAGASFALRATVRNQGNRQSAAATTLRYYRSTDATITTRDTEVGTDAVGVLAPSRTSFESITLTAPSSAGAYYYGACVDAVSGESDTENNCSLAVTVTVGAPDLVVDAPTVSNSTPTAGASFALRATVRNQGNSQSAATTLRWFLSTDATLSANVTEVGRHAVGVLAASRTSAESISLTAPSSAGTYYYGACVESVSGESNTGNNCSAAVTVNVGAAPAPDLVVDTPTVSNSSPTAGASFTLSATVRNQGNGQSAATTLRWFLSTDATLSANVTEVGRHAVGVLAASRTSAESISLTAPSSAGTYYYGACVESVSGESDTGNNCSAAVTVTVSAAPAPDLVVDAPTVSNSSPTAGASFTLSATVGNQGTGQSTATTLRFYRSTDGTISASDTEVGSQDVGGLSSFGRSEHSIELTAPSSAGTYYYGACVESVSDESDTGNNCSAAVTVNVAPAPDLVVDSPTVIVGSPTAGADFVLSATVRNQGTGQSAATTLRWFLSTDATISTSDTQVGTDEVLGLSASGTSAEWIIVYFPANAGNYYYGACVESVSGESNTENNCSPAVHVDVGAPDLVVGTPRAIPSNPTAGASFYLRVTVENQGTGPGLSAAATLRFYRSTDGTISDSDTEVGSLRVGSLAVSGTRNRSIVLTAPSSAGTYYYGACVESDSWESNTGNNCSAAVTVTVVAPDLVVDLPTVSDSNPTAGASFTLNATVRNQGTGQSVVTTLRFYRSTDATISASDTEVGSDAVGVLSASGTSGNSIELTAPSSAGAYYYGACVESVSDETDTGNNCSAAVSITVSTAPPPATGTSKLYWTDWGTDKIQRADLDGSNVEDLVSDAGLDGPDGLALDPSGGKIYWTNVGSNKIQRADLDGANVEDLITSGLSVPYGLALDPSGGKMYWTNRQTSKIQRADLDGTNIEDLLTLPGLAFPGELALDVSAGKMYWTNPGSDKIQRANLDGANVEDLVTSGLNSPTGLALDLSGGKIYWTDRGTHKVQRANPDGSNVEDLVASGLSTPTGLALDVSGGKMYWTDVDGDKIQRANLDGSSVEDLVTSADGLVDPSGLAVGVISQDTGTGGGDSTPRRQVMQLRDQLRTVRPHLKVPHTESE